MNNRVFTLFLSFFICLLMRKASAQQDPLYSQYMFNGAIINPAYPSQDDVPSLTAVGRNQWVGIDGAPKTGSLSFHYPFKSNTTAGIMMYYDKIGVIQETAIGANISQRVNLGSNRYLALGLRLGPSFYRENNSELNTNDPVFQHNRSYTRTDVGFGLLYFTDRLSVGLSSPNFRKLNLDPNSPYQLTTQPHFFLQGSYLIDLNESLKIKPGTLVKYTEGAPLQVDLNTNLLIKELLWLGASWRSSKTVVGIFQIQVTNSFQIGYSYDYDYGKYLSRYNGGSHEIMLNYRFPHGDQRVVAPRSFNY